MKELIFPWLLLKMGGYNSSKLSQNVPLCGSLGQLQRLEGTVLQDCFPFWHQVQVSGVLQTLLQFNYLLERPTELTESCCTRGYSLILGKDRDWGQPKEEHRAEPGRVRQIWSFWCLLPMESGCITFPELLCGNMYGVLSIRDAHPNLSIQTFYWYSIM